MTRWYLTFLQIIGVGPDGMLSTGVRIPSLVNGLLFFILAYLYWLPNEKAQFHKKRYLVITGFFAVAAMNMPRSKVMVSNGRVSTLKGDHLNRLPARTKPLRVPVRPRVCAHPI